MPKQHNVFCDIIKFFLLRGVLRKLNVNFSVAQFELEQLVFLSKVQLFSCVHKCKLAFLADKCKLLPPRGKHF